MREMKIGKNEAGQRLDKYLAKVLAQAPKSFLYKMLRKKNIVLNGKKASGSEILCEEDLVKFFLSDETMDKFSREEFHKTDHKLDVVFENDQLLVVNKPSGLLSQKEKKEDVSLVEQIISYLLDTGSITKDQLSTFRPGICNRLDRNTSGLVIGGKTLYALQTLSEMVRKRSVGKYYLCITAGVLRNREKIKGYLYKDTKTNKVTVSKHETKGSYPIETAYRPLGTNGKCTLCEVELITGRTHQIRSHLASIGHPILGDRKYGDTKWNLWAQKNYGIENQLLHAWRLEFPETTPAELKIRGRIFQAPLPAEFSNMIKGEKLSEESIYGGE